MRFFITSHGIPALTNPVDAAKGALEGRSPGSKTLLRQQALAGRKAVPPEIAQAFAARLAQDAPKLLAHLARQTVSAYWPIGSEADTRPLLAALAAHGFATALPVTGARGTPLVFRLWRDGDRQINGQMAIPEPAPDLPAVDPDILFVPLAAFDRRGHRIGYGAGHYDCTLAALRAKKPVLAIGLGFAVQEIPQVPAEAHDAKLDFVLTERELVDCRT